LAGEARPGRRDHSAVARGGRRGRRHLAPRWDHRSLLWPVDRASPRGARPRRADLHRLRSRSTSWSSLVQALGTAVRGRIP